jgi:hypothetical protein
MLPVFLDYTLLITLCVLFNVYLLQSVQCVVANVTFVPRLLIVDYPLCFCLRFIYYSLFSELWPMLPLFRDYSLLITLCVLFNVYLLQSVQCVVANVTCVPRLLIVDYPLCFD